MKTVRKWYSADIKSKVALEAIPGDLMLAKLAAKPGAPHMMFAAWSLAKLARLRTSRARYCERY